MKKIYMGLGTVFGIFIAIAITAYAAEVIQQDELRWGRGSSSADKILKADIGAGTNNPVLRVNPTTAKWEFSNDNVNFSDIGAGSGGSAGINVLINPDAETGNLTGFNNVGGGTLVITTTTADVAFGENAFEFDAGSASDAFVSDQIDVPVGLFDQNCLGRIYYKGGDSDLTLEVIDGSSNVLSSQTLATSAGYRTESAMFVCPSSGTIALRVIAAADATVVQLDNLHLGENFLLGTAAQAELIALAKYDFTASCNWARTNTALGDFPVAAACPAINVIDSSEVVDTTDTDLPELNFLNNVPPGKYVVTASFLMDNSTAGANLAYRISDGTNSGALCGQDLATMNDKSTATCHHVVNITSSSALNLKMQGSASAGNAAIFNSTQTGELTWKVVRYPSSQQVLRSEQDSWHVNVNIGGANPDLGMSSVATYSPIENGGLDLVINSGSLAAKIPCSSTNPATGLTCGAGDESVGVQFELPTAGKVLACASFGHRVDMNAASDGVRSAFQLVETGNADQVIAQEGGSRIPSGTRESAGGEALLLPNRNCGIFNFTSVGTKTLRLFYEQLIEGTPTSSQVLADRSATVGQRDIHIEVYPLRNFLQAPIIVNSVQTPSASGINIASAEITCSGSSAINQQDGTWLASVGNISAGDCLLTFAAGIFSGKPNCFANEENIALPANILGYSSGSSSSIVLTCADNAGVNCSGSFNATVMCVGPR